MRTQAQQLQKNPQWNLKEYTSEFLLDGANQFAFTFPILMIPIIKAFSGEPLLLIVYLALLAMLFGVFFVVYHIKNSGKLSFRRKISAPWAFRQVNNNGDRKLPRFLKDYGFGSTSVFLSILMPMLYFTAVDLTDPGPGKQSAFWFAFICIVGWDLVIYLFSIAAGMERQFNAWKRENITRNMTSAQYADFQRDEYLAERGRAAGFNEGYMVGRNSKH